MTHNVVRVFGVVRHIYRGTERRDNIKLNGKLLHGWVSVKKQGGIVTETTHYKDRYVLGYNWVWLARRNSRTIKVDRGLNPYIPDKEYETPRLREIAERIDFLFKELDKVDKELSEL